MASTYKPPDSPDVSVYLVARDAEAVIEFALQALGAKLLRRENRADGTLSHGELRIGDSIVMLSQANDQYPGFPVWLHVYVDDVDRAIDQAVTAGGKVVQPPSSGDDGDRRAGVEDASGNVWWLATTVRATDKSSRISRSPDPT